MSSKKTDIDFPKQILLFIVLIIIVRLIFELPIIDSWYNGRIKGYYSSMKKQKRKMSTEYRLTQRNPMVYNVAKFLEEKLDSGTTVLLPPRKYLEKNKVPYFLSHVNILYYYTDKIICYRFIDSLSINKSQYTFISTKKGISLVELNSTTVRNQIVKEFSKEK